MVLFQPASESRFNSIGGLGRQYKRISHNKYKHDLCIGCLVCTWLKLTDCQKNQGEITSRRLIALVVALRNPRQGAGEVGRKSPLGAQAGRVTSCSVERSESDVGRGAVMEEGARKPRRIHQTRGADVGVLLHHCHDGLSGPWLKGISPYVCGLELDVCLYSVGVQSW